ncbi:hypothetical protein V492_01081, partial [Pseudogymnoascus sp. VKM F-4246]
LPAPQEENSYNPPLPQASTFFFSFSSFFYNPKIIFTSQQTTQHHHPQNGLTALSLPDAFKIHFETLNNLPNSTPQYPVLFEDLNNSIPRNSSSSHQLPTTILPNVFTTATQNPQSTWPTQPQSTSPLAPQQSQQPSPSTDYHQTPPDFVLFPRRSLEASPNAQNIPNLPRNHAPSGSNRRHSANPLSAPSLQNQRVAAIIQGTGHQVSSPAFTTRYNPFAQQQQQQQQNQQFYALSAPSSSAALQSQNRTRPQVPLFSQSTGNINSNKHQSFPNPNNMAQGNYESPHSLPKNDSRSHLRPDMNLFDDFDSFDLKSDNTVNFPDLDYKYSPAVPTMYSPAPMNRTDSASTSMGTVSPQDLMVRDATFSAPNSTVFTNLTSPSQYNESPDYLHDLDVSPMYNSDDLTQGDPWFPLFPDGDASFPAPPAPETSLAADEEAEVGDALRERRRRSDSSPHSKAASAAAGVSARKRNQPLPPIVVEDPNDTVAIKRARNTLAARKSRQKKMERFDELEAEIAKIAAERDMWKAKALARGAN